LARLAVGRAKTRGLGTIRLEVAEEEFVDLLPALEERFQRLQEVWQQIHPGAPGASVFTLTLHSDSLLLDDLWRYTSVLDEGFLAHEYTNAPACTLQRWFARTCLVGGWNAAHRMPKEDELAVLKGSAFLYTTTTSAALLLPWLRDLEEHGIGERRNEGFGRIVACHPFHWRESYNEPKPIGG
jgi:CRISPR-associated protein Csx10